MEIDGFHSKVNDPQVAQLIDNILDTVLALKARLTDSNMDSNSIGGITVFPGTRPVPPGNRRCAAGRRRWRGEGRCSRS
jgi:hypothetical protein